MRTNLPEHNSGSCKLSPLPSSDSPPPIHPRPDSVREKSDTAVTSHRETRPHHHPLHQHPMRLRPFTINFLFCISSRVPTTTNLGQVEDRKRTQKGPHPQKVQFYLKIYSSVCVIYQQYYSKSIACLITEHQVIALFFIFDEP